ncbi:glycosyltransferase family 2 protein [Thalassotalea litorea]|uniref:glycosyltransferase family 2 protein n=1 Tax=Thalassotalea litorea TaxID=2020715 RepID=UPI003735D71A
MVEPLNAMSANGGESVDRAAALNAKVPKVSVIMPVYNAGAYLYDSVSSILQQTFQDFELLILDDGSTDNSAEILLEFAASDPRVRVFLRANHGLIASLNYLVNKARANLIARMDADDISVPTRIERQVRFFKGHPDIAILGTGYEYIDRQGNRLGERKTQTEHEDIVASFFFGNAIAHPSVMFHRNRLPKGWLYDNTFEGAEDLALWLVLSDDVKLANLPEPLLRYRISGQSESDTKHTLQQQNACRAIYLNTHLCRHKNGESISRAIYNRRGGIVQYPRFLYACIQLMISNATSGNVPVWPLFKRTMMAQLTFFKRSLRQLPKLEETPVE